MRDKEKEGITFGSIDMIVTLLGVIIGLSFSGDHNIILTGIIVTGVADSFANASGIYAISHIETGVSSVRPAIFCFLSTYSTMLILLFPFLAFPCETATYISATIALVLLVLLGYYATPKESKTTKPYLIPLRILFIGVTVSIICYIVGSVLL